MKSPTYTQSACATYLHIGNCKVNSRDGKALEDALDARKKEFSWSCLVCLSILFLTKHFPCISYSSEKESLVVFSTCLWLHVLSNLDLTCTSVWDVLLAATIIQLANINSSLSRQSGLTSEKAVLTHGQFTL